MNRHTRHDVTSDPRSEIGGKPRWRWRGNATWLRTRLRGRRRIAVVVLAAAMIAILPALVLVAGLRSAYAATGAVATLSTTYINFGDQQVGTTSAGSPITLSNTGTATLDVTGDVLSGANPSDYVLAGGTCANATGGTSVQIAPGGSCTMSVSFQPTATGTRTGTLTVSCDAANCPLSGSVTGNGTNPGETVSPTTMSFPDTYVGASSAAPVQVSICNNGTTDLDVSAISVSGANPGDFSYSTAATLPASVSAGNCIAVNTTFTPSAMGARAATLNFTTNDSLHTQNVSLSGMGLLPADLSVTLSGSPNPVKSGTHLTYTITVANNGAGFASGVTLANAVPTGTTFASVTTTSGTCSAPAVGGTGTVTCTARGLSDGANFVVTLVVTIKAHNGTTVSDTVSVSASTQDPNLANNSASVTTTVGNH